MFGPSHARSERAGDFCAALVLLKLWKRRSCFFDLLRVEDYPFVDLAGMMNPPILFKQTRYDCLVLLSASQFSLSNFGGEYPYLRLGAEQRR